MYYDGISGEYMEKLYFFPSFVIFDIIVDRG